MSKSQNNVNVFDYIKWRGDLSFSQSKLNKVDCLIFTMLNLLNYADIIGDDEISIKDISHKYFKGKKSKDLKIGLFIPKTFILLLKNISNTNRYKDVMVSDYLVNIDYDNDEQTNALTFLIDDKTMVISFCGTDDTIVGWKEDLMMIYKNKIGSSKVALNYVKNVISKYPHHKFYIVGHSKGGYLAINSAINLDEDLSKRLIKAISFDGPGQNETEVLKEDLDYVKTKIETILPQASTVGRLFNHHEKMEYIYSTQSYLYQHDPFSWQVCANDFVYTDKLDQDSINLNNKINEVLSQMNEEERHNMVDNLYKLLSVDGTRDLTTLYTKRNSLVSAYLKMNKKEKEQTFKPFLKLLKDKSARKIALDAIRCFVIESKKESILNKEIDKE